MPHHQDATARPVHDVTPANASTIPSPALTPADRLTLAPHVPALLWTVLEQAIDLMSLLARGPAGWQVEWVNKAAQGVGTTVGQVFVGKTVAECLVEPTRSQVLQVCEAAAATGETQTLEHQSVDPSRTMDSQFHPVRGSDGRVGYILVVSRDVTEKKAAEAALQDARARLLHAEKDEALARLAGGMAHDFNNLLNIILGYTSIAQDEVEPGSDIAEYLAASLDACQRAARLTQQLLAVSRRAILRPKAVVLEEEIGDVVRLLAASARPGRQVVAEVGPWPTWVNLDPSGLRQVLVHLGTNGMDALGPEGRVVFRVRTEHLATPLIDNVFGRDRRVPAGTWVCLEVSDDGIGMPPHVLSRLFEPFFTTKPRGRGTGLGLSTSLGIVEQSGGYLQVDSLEGRGSRVRVWLPPSEPLTTWGQPPTDAAPDGVVARLRGRQVFLVEDEAGVRDVLMLVLHNAGCHVEVASDGLDAWTRLSGRTTPPDLVVTDVAMPNLSGGELAARLKDRWPHLPILFVTGFAPSQELNAELIGSSEVLHKPFAPATLLTRLAAALADPRPG